MMGPNWSVSLFCTKDYFQTTCKTNRDVKRDGIDLHGETRRFTQPNNTRASVSELIIFDKNTFTINPLPTNDFKTRA